MANKANHRLIVKKSLEILIEENALTQKEISKKLKALDFSLSLSTISNLYNDKENLGPQVLRKAAKGLQELLRIEYCLHFDEASKSYVAIPDGKARVVTPVKETFDQMNPVSTPPFVLHDGRLDVPEKVAFFQQAQSEIIEIGIRLRNFKNYFDDKRDSAFLDPITQVLERGVDFKCYVLKPDGNFARRYFEDRAQDLLIEKENYSSSSKILNELIALFEKINKEGHKGQMKLYSYEHFPYFHATVVDGHTAHGQMCMSSYLYGVSRANTPVLQLTKRKNKTLFKKYWKSVKSFTTHGVKELV